MHYLRRGAVSGGAINNSPIRRYVFGIYNPPVGAVVSEAFYISPKNSRGNYRYRSHFGFYRRYDKQYISCRWPSGDAFCRGIQSLGSTGGTPSGHDRNDWAEQLCRPVFG